MSHRQAAFIWGAVLSVSAFAVPVAVRADSHPVIVIPSRPGVPVVINGRDASYAVVEGDWGLSRPGAVPVTVYGGSPIRPNPVYEPRRSYHPRYGRAPDRGRHEIEPASDRPMPEPAESFSRSWSSSSDIQPPRQETSRNDTPDRAPQIGSAGSDIVPATITDPATFQQPIIIAPGDRRRRNHP